jgi:hypothetical protein
MPRWHICQLLFWFLSVQLRTDVQRLCADLPRSVAARLIQFRAFPAHLALSTNRCLESCPCKSNSTFHLSRRTTLHRRWGAETPTVRFAYRQIANQFPSQGEHYASRNFSQ